MTDLIANDHEETWAADLSEMPSDRESRDSDESWHAPKRHAALAWVPDPYERRTATARRGRAILIIAALSALSWAAVLLIVIAALYAF